MESLFSSFAASSSSLFSSLIDSTVQPSSDDAPTLVKTSEAINLQPSPHPHTSLLHDDIVKDDNAKKENEISSPDLSPTLSPITSPILSSTPHKVPNTADLIPPLSPVLSSTPRSGPLTQDLVDRMLDLRRVDDIDEGVLAVYRRENEELKSEVAALRLEREDLEKELVRVRQLLSQQSPQQQQPQSAQQQQPQQQQAQSSSDGYTPVVSKKKKKKKNKTTANVQAAEAASAAANTTRPPGCDSIQLPPILPASSQPQPPQQPQPNQQQHPTLPNVYIYHDSNLKGTTAAEIASLINNINNKNNNSNSNKSNNSNNPSYNIILQETFTLPQTLIKIKHTTYKNNDKVIINTMTNDARNTNHRHRRTPNRTKQIQTDIIQHLISFIPHDNITILESPPLLDSPSSDIFPYNSNSYSLSQQLGVHFAGTLIGEQHLWTDGYHVQRNSRPLLVKSVAAAVAGVNPREHFGLARPPFGLYGPWAAPKGTGLLPSYRDRAISQPFVFRRAAPIRPLMEPYVRRP